MEKMNKSGTPRRTVLTGAAALGLTATAANGAKASRGTQREFSGKTAFVTGAARGIGRACALSLAKRGANVALFDIASQIAEVPYPLATAEDLADTKAAVEANNVKCITIAGDTRNLAAQKSAMARAVDELGGLDFVIANAGITQIGQLEQFSEAELSLIIDINLKGVIKTIQAATPILRAQNSGRIVLMSSVTGRAGNPSFPIYSATKWGVIGLAKSTALALGPHNVTCNALCPTLVHTKLLDNDYVLSNVAPGQTLTFEQFNEIAKGMHVLPVGFFGPEHVGEAAAFCCSEGSALISGDVFDIGAGANAQFPA